MLLKRSSMWVSHLLVHQMELSSRNSSFHLQKGNTTLIDLKRILLKTGKATTAQRGCRVYGADDRPDPSLQSHIRPLLPGLRQDFETFASQTRWLLNFDQITNGRSGGCGILPAWRPAEAGSGLVRASCGNCAKTCKVNCSPSKVFCICLYVEFRNSEAHQELVDKAQLIQEALTEKREEWYSNNVEVYSKDNIKSIATTILTILPGIHSSPPHSRHWEGQLRWCWRRSPASQPHWTCTHSLPISENKAEK